MLDVSDAAEQRKPGELIPDGSFVNLQMNIRPGDVSLNGMDAIDTGLFKASKSSDVVMLDLELTVLEPAEFAHRKLFENWVVSGGSVDEKGVSKGWNMTKSRIRAVLESATGTSPKDESAQARALRQIQGFKTLDGYPFYAKLRVEDGGDRPGGGSYPDKNVIDYIVTPDDPEYAELKAGRPVAAKPRGSAKAGAKPAGGPAAAPAWQQGQPAAAQAPSWAGQQPTPAAAPPAAQAQLPGTAPAAAQAVTAAGPAWLNR